MTAGHQAPEGWNYHFVTHLFSCPVNFIWTFPILLLFHFKHCLHSYSLIFVFAKLWHHSAPFSSTDQWKHFCPFSFFLFFFSFFLLTIFGIRHKCTFPCVDIDLYSFIYTSRFHFCDWKRWGKSQLASMFKGVQESKTVVVIVPLKESVGVGLHGQE